MSACTRAPEPLGSRKSALRAASRVLAISCVLLAGCARTGSSPAIQITNLPLAQPGDAHVLTTIGGRAIGAQPNQVVILYARAESTWYVQPFADQPFTAIQTDGSWKNLTHPGMQYAALLVGPDFRPPPRTDVLPANGVLASAVTKGKPPVWERWWFLSACALMVLLGIFAIHRYRLRQVAAKMNMRFEDRLAERMHVAQILHDTLLQGVISASMQLHVAVDQLPLDSPALPPLNRVLQSMGQVLEEGRNTLRALRSPTDSAHDLEQSLSRVPEELNVHDERGFRLVVKGPALPLQPGITGQLYSIGRGALVQAYRKRGATNVEVELRYSAREFRLVIRDNGRRKVAAYADEEAARTMLSERAAKIGARLTVRNRWTGGKELDIRVPGPIAFESPGLAGASVSVVNPVRPELEEPRPSE